MSQSMGWLAAYQRSKAIKVELRKELGESIPDFYVLLLDPKTKTQAWMQEKTTIPDWTAEEFEAADPERRDKMLKQSTEFLSEMILEWDITDPETGEPLPLPKDDKRGNVLSKLPIEINVLFNDKIKEAFEALRAGPPLPTEKQSGQL